MRRPSRRPVRTFLAVAICATAIALPGGAALGAHQVARTGSPGTWVLPDTAADPAAGCSYDGGGVAGGTYLTGIRLRNDVELRGTTSGLRSVAYRPLVQHRVAGHWRTVRKGTLVSGNASASHAAVLPGGLTTFGPKTQPRNPFRLALRLIWYRADASVQGTRTILVDRYAKRDSGLGSRCAGFVSDVPTAS